jgi:hypothetical protein
MKKLLPVWIVLLLLTLTSNVYAQGKVYKFSIRNALNDTRANTNVNPHIKLRFSDRHHKGKLLTTTRKTMHFGRSAQEACNRAFLSAIIALQRKARRSVVDIYSYRFKRKYSSSSKYVCERGRMMTAVTLRGRVR